ncbi:MAG: (2Fe-2S)-binding protein [Myxococcota bacterium]|nr:(2Fe-2S)-binding protein [Myxococcota bacterium]MDW8362424.1 2Fe-2S iron-sulfur cluster-binding protein [Myxococcales bacterium]
MTTVRFEPAGYEVVDVPVGTRIMDLTDAHPAAGVPYSCRSASCGTCRVEVLEGAEGLPDPADDELEVLDVFGNEPRVRLCCQMRLVRPVTRLRLRVVEPEPV